MSGGRHGRRDNGLYAAAYAPVGDVDPRIGEHMLDVLGNRGIAAYLQPTSDQHPITRVTTLPSRPTDRLYVDRSEVDTARQFLAVLTRDTAIVGGISEPDDTQDTPADPAPAARTSPEHDDPLADGPAFESAWASIVANFDQATAPDPTIETPWPADEDGADEAEAPAATEPHQWRVWRGPATEPSLLDGLDTFGDGLSDDEEEDYHPPEPPPLPRLAPVTVIGIVAIVLGIVLVADPRLISFFDHATATFLGCALMLGGAITLIGRMRPGDDDDDDRNDGAVV